MDQGHRGDFDEEKALEVLQVKDDLGERKKCLVFETTGIDLMARFDHWDCLVWMN